MTPVANDSGVKGYIEILDRESDSDLESEYWISLSSFRQAAGLAPAILAEYTFGGQERFVVSTGKERIVLEPFASDFFIIGCAENFQFSRGADLFLTGGEEEDIWLIDSDGEHVAILEVGDHAAQEVLTAPLGGAFAFERIDKRLLQRVVADVRCQLLRVKISDWVNLIRAWSEQYVSLLDFLLKVREGKKAQTILSDRERLVSADLSFRE